MLYDRLSFRGFCRFGLTDKIPDETTLCRFRGVLQEHTEKLFQMVMEEISKQEIKVKSSAIVEATVIPRVCALPKEEKFQRRILAGWTKKGGKFIYSYKAHVSADKGTGLVKRVIATSGNVHNSQVFAPLLKGIEGQVYANKANSSWKSRQFLKTHQIQDQIMIKEVRVQKGCRPGKQT